MLSLANTAALVIGWVVIGFAGLLGVATIVTTINDSIRARWKSYDMWLYDDNRRWNRKKRELP